MSSHLPRTSTRGRGGTVPQAVLAAVRARGPGYVFTPDDLFDLGTRAAIDQALSRLARAGKIRRLARGVYDYPKVSPRLGPLTASPETIAEALARKGGTRLQISGARAANALGLSTQVPGRSVYLTDGAARTRRIAGQLIELRRAVPRTLDGAGTTPGAVIQALRYLGPDEVTEQVITHLIRVLSVDDRQILGQLRRSAPGWMQPALNRIAESADRSGQPDRATAPRAAEGSDHDG